MNRKLKKKTWKIIISQNLENICPDGFTLVDQACLDVTCPVAYYNWYDAKAECEKKNSKLTQVENEAVNDWVRILVQPGV